MSLQTVRTMTRRQHLLGLVIWAAQHCFCQLGEAHHLVPETLSHQLQIQESIKQLLPAKPKAFLHFLLIR